MTAYKNPNFNKLMREALDEQDKREDLRKFVMEQQGETVAPSEEDQLADRAVNALVSIAKSLEEISKTEKNIFRMIQRIG